MLVCSNVLVVLHIIFREASSRKLASRSRSTTCSLHRHQFPSRLSVRQFTWLVISGVHYADKSKARFFSELPEVVATIIWKYQARSVAFASKSHTILLPKTTHVRGCRTLTGFFVVCWLGEERRDREVAVEGNRYCL